MYMYIYIYIYIYIYMGCLTFGSAVNSGAYLCARFMCASTG